MSARARTSTVRLPQALRDEIEAQNEPSKAGRMRKSGAVNRKAERKAERQLAKQRKAQFFSKGAGQTSFKRGADVESGDGSSLARKKLKLQQAVTAEPKALKSDRHTKNKPPEIPAEETASLSKKAKEAKSVNITQKRSRKEEEENAYISMLERRLGVNKRKSGKSRYGGGFEEDGLLDLLLDLDEKVLNDVDEEDEQTDESDEGDDDDGLQTQDRLASGSEESSEVYENEWTGFVTEESSREETGATSSQTLDDEPAEGLTSGSRYVPPHLRKQLSVHSENSSEADPKLARLLKGLLNRLSEQNIDSILKEIEGLYSSHRRHDITSTLTSLIIEGTCSHSILLDSYVALHAGLVACLHKIIGVELAAYFVQTVITIFERHYAKSAETFTNVDSSTNGDPLGKECSNLLVLLSDLYNFHVISCTLMYDIIRLILEGNLTELDVELILKLARGSGVQLRQDDPSALKDIIQIIQSKLGDQRNASSRTHFMVDTLNSLKNNKLRKHAAAAQGGGESKERISKFVAGIGKKYHVHAHEPLRITLDDLRQADSKGKWWLVGAAWGGDPLVDQNFSRAQTSSSQVPADAENILLKLARKQGMNTDVRRSVFIVLMSSDDYVDACDRLAQLNLTDVQQREIIRVLLHCCGNEMTYNPYYTLIGQHLCRQSHSYQVTLQYCFWDFLRSLGEANVGGTEMAKSFEDERNEVQGFELDRVSSTRMANVACAYAWWVAKDCVAITMLKTLDFVALKNKTQTFLRQFFTQLFICSQDPSFVPGLGRVANSPVLARRDAKALEDTLLKAVRVPALALGIVYFLSVAFRQADTENKEKDDFVQWGCDVAKDALRSALETSALQ